LPPTLNQKKQSTQTDRQTRLVVSSSQINPVGALTLEEGTIRVRAGAGAHRWSTPASQRAKVVPPAAAAAAAARKERKRGRRLLVVEEAAAGVGCGWVESGRRREERGRSARRGRERRRREAAAMAVWPRC
jgi:hypothetical protein